MPHTLSQIPFPWPSKTLFLTPDAFEGTSSLTLSPNPPACKSDMFPPIETKSIIGRAICPGLNLISQICTKLVKSVKSKRKLPNIQPPTAEELSDFYSSFENTTQKPVIFSILPKYSSSYMDDCLKDLPDLSSVYDIKYTESSIQELVDMALSGKFDSHINVNHAQVSKIEQLTRKHAHCSLWFKFRAGRVTASNIKRCIRTSIIDPSKSLVMSVCYPSR